MLPDINSTSNDCDLSLRTSQPRIMKTLSIPGEHFPFCDCHYMYSSWFIEENRTAVAAFFSTTRNVA
jgi:hypothetical protein